MRARCGISLPEAIALITDRPARLAGLHGSRPPRAGTSVPIWCACALHDDAARGAPGVARRRTRRVTGGRCAGRGLLCAAAGRSAVRRSCDLAGPRSGERRAGAAARPSRHRRDHRRTAALRVSCDAEAADAVGRRDRLVSTLVNAAAELAARIAPFALPPLAVADLHGFLALRETNRRPPLQALADACVERLDQFRAPPSEAELGAPAPCPAVRGSRTRCCAAGAIRTCSTRGSST